MKVEWKLGIGDLHGDISYVVPSEMEHQEILPDGIIWRGHPVCGPDFTVEVRCRPQERTGLTSATFRYEGYAGKDFVEEVYFPVLTCPYDSKTQVLNATQNTGEIVGSADQLTPGQNHLFECHSTSLFALLYPEGTGFYLDSRSPEIFPKSISFKPLKDHEEAILSFLFQPGCGSLPQKAWEMPGECVFGTFKGSWYEAARIYREWGTKQWWFTNRKKDNPLRTIGLWVWNRGPADVVIPPLMKLREELPDIPLALDWYWWHHNPYDTDYPLYWPPREGIENFKKSVQQLKDKNIWTQVYMNGECWDMDNPSWSKGGEQEVIQLRNGKPLAVAFNAYTKHRLAFMCGEAPIFQDLLAEQVRNLRECGLSGQYLDMIGGCTNMPCYNPKHKHDRGGGSFMAQGYRDFLKRLKRENPDYPLSTEYSNEIYMDLLDGSIICAIANERFGNDNIAVPVFPAIYHGRQALALFGNYALPDGIPPWDALWPAEDRWKTEDEKPWQELFPEQFYVEIMKNVIFGTQPMVCNLTSKIYTDPAFKDIWNVILHVARFYHENIPWLFDGEMLSPDGFECGEKEVSFFSRMIFTKKDTAKTITRKMPVIMHSVWRNEEGKEALFMGNYTKENQTAHYRGQELTVPPHSCVRVDLTNH